MLLKSRIGLLVTYVINHVLHILHYFSVCVRFG
nr:unnamed protein product [Callosobruchus analis]